jgi:hypothetical protein
MRCRFAACKETRGVVSLPYLDFFHGFLGHNTQENRVEAGTDLFGVWVVEISYGRIGTAGRSRSYLVRDEGEARRLAQSILKRRATAPRRIGVPYRVRELIDPAGWAGVLCDNPAREAKPREAA